MLSERALQISPLVPESIQHNTKTLSTLHNLSASLFGIGAGILGLESYPGFLFYLVLSLLVSGLVWALRIRGQGSRKGMEGVGLFFTSTLDFWIGGLPAGLSGFVLTWTLFYALVRA